MKQYEFKVKEFKSKSIWKGRLNIPDLENELNALGGEGWELVSSSEWADVGSTQKLVFVFKREKQV